MAVGDFQCLDGSRGRRADSRLRHAGQGQPRAGSRSNPRSAILKFYNGYYAIKYPFGKLDLVAVPDFAAGAMENTAAIFFRETDLLADARTASVADAQEHRRHHRPRDGAPVVRRSGDDGVVGRPVAERGVRDVDVESSARGVEARVARRRRRGEREPAGAQPRLAGVDASDSRRRREPGRDRRLVRRHHLSEGRGGPAHGRRATSAPRRSGARSTAISRRTPTATRPRRISGPRSPRRRDVPSIGSCRRSSISRACRSSRSRRSRATARRPRRVATFRQSRFTLDAGRAARRSALADSDLVRGQRRQVPGLAAGLVRPERPEPDADDRARLRALGLRQRRRRRLLPDGVSARHAARDGPGRADRADRTRAPVARRRPMGAGARRAAGRRRFSHARHRLRPRADERRALAGHVAPRGSSTTT